MTVVSQVVCGWALYHGKRKWFCGGAILVATITLQMCSLRNAYVKTGANLLLLSEALWTFVVTSSEFAFSENVTFTVLIKLD